MVCLEVYTNTAWTQYQAGFSGRTLRLHKHQRTPYAGSCLRLVRRAAPRLALEGGEQMLTQFLWNVVLQVDVHEEPEALIVNGLKGNREGADVS